MNEPISADRKTRLLPWEQAGVTATTPSLYRRIFKRVFDILFAAALLFMLAPLMLILAVAGAMDGASPIYAQRRVGRGGRPFRCLKFRSMVPDAEARLRHILANDPVAADEWRRTQKLANDPRVTWYGRMIRKYSLDELPQLWNVLRGDMSLVGPRPVTERELALYGPSRAVVLSTRPGLTGLWQVNGRGRDISYAERVNMDLTYVRSIHLIGDLTILLATILVVLRGTGS
jgi:lipopolysaccharide/colanic/teichoic acid biosynthesis glycosyltransferase